MSRESWLVLLLLLGLTTVVHGVAYQGYGKQETPTGEFKAYCVNLDYSFLSGLCTGYAGSTKVCAAAAQADNQLSAENWRDSQVMSKTSPVMDRTLQEGDQAFQKLELYFLNWACKQLGENVRQKATLTAAQQKEAACNYVWRRDQEIQDNKEFSVPATGLPWGDFLYKPPGMNLTQFTFKGIPKSQCGYDHDCREFNNPGQVYTCCDYCEYYFNSFCDTTPDVVFKFCMEKVQCVCNSVRKPCYKPKKERCPKLTGCPVNFADGLLYPVYGAPCSSSPRRLVGTLMVTLTALALACSIKMFT
uniref:Phospholipase A2 domain-containing protein n=1 Tax=Hanusia phi TaxID=3032 RepID=A0A7S0HMB3_9CRYP